MGPLSLLFPTPACVGRRTDAHTHTHTLAHVTHTHPVQHAAAACSRMHAPESNVLRQGACLLNLHSRLQRGRRARRWVRWFLHHVATPATCAEPASRHKLARTRNHKQGLAGGAAWPTAAGRGGTRRNETPLTAAKQTHTTRLPPRAAGHLARRPCPDRRTTGLPRRVHARALGGRGTAQVAPRPKARSNGTAPPGILMKPTADGRTAAHISAAACTLISPIPSPSRYTRVFTKKWP
jgi:hypothetical protein